MQHLRGETIRQAVQRNGRFTGEDTERILRELGSALVYLHEQGVVHRDVKPENIFLEHGTGRAVLSDFGLAKGMDGLVDVTLAGSVIGTPAYMSPEQIDGSEMDGRSDVYSLGLVAYELLSGVKPWDGGAEWLASDVPWIPYRVPDGPKRGTGRPAAPGCSAPRTTTSCPNGRHSTIHCGAQLPGCHSAGVVYARTHPRDTGFRNRSGAPYCSSPAFRCSAVQSDRGARRAYHSTAAAESRSGAVASRRGAAWQGRERDR